MYSNAVCYLKTVILINSNIINKCNPVKMKIPTGFCALMLKNKVHPHCSYRVSEGM